MAAKLVARRLSDVTGARLPTYKCHILQRSTVRRVSRSDSSLYLDQGFIWVGVRSETQSSPSHRRSQPLVHHSVLSARGGMAHPGEK